MEDLLATASRLRATVPQISPSSRLPRAQELAAALAAHTETPLPSLSGSPVEVEERVPSPQTPHGTYRQTPLNKRNWNFSTNL